MSDELISQHLQDSFVYLCITSDDFLGLVRPILLPGFLSNTISENCVRICYDYWDMFGRAPGDHFHDELTRRLKDVNEKDRSYYAPYLEKVSALSPPNENYVIRRVSAFCKYKEFENAAVEFAQLVQRGEFEEAQNLMYKALRAGIEKENIGGDYTGDLSNLKRRGLRDDNLISSGVPALDKIIGGLSLGQFVVILGGYKGKKSWALLNIARVAMLQGMNVLYVTHELTQEQIERRMDMMCGGMVASRQPAKVSILQRDPKSGVFSSVVEERPSIFDVKAVEKVRRTLRRFGGRFIIKKYPMGTCTMAELERYLNYLEKFEGFVPDVVLNDYADIMQFVGRGENLRHGINEVYIQHKTIADERGMLVVTVSQVTREAIRRKRVRMENVAEDIRKIANVDLALAVSQTDEMSKEGIASMSVVASRDGLMDVGCNLLMNLSIGQFCSVSWLD